MAPARIVSGGQSGVDRAALDFAIRHGIAVGGWCPRGGWAEDREQPPGLLSDYPMLRETASADPTQRTEWNARDSDATLIVARAGVRSAGTELTAKFAAEAGKPLLVVEVGRAAGAGGGGAAQAVREFADGLPRRSTLNVAGPRESEAPGIYREAGDLLDAALGAILGES